MESKRINCNECKHYYVTWDPKFPKGCKAHHFKTKHLPSLEVFRASGHSCYAFEKKMHQHASRNGRRTRK